MGSAPASGLRRDEVATATQAGAVRRASRRTANSGKRLTEMKADGMLKHVAAAFSIAVGIYIIAYTGIEHRRTRRGPWQVTFTNDSSGTPVLLINQARLAITNVRVVFPGEAPSTNAAVALSFSNPFPVPCDVPFGKCIFMDTTFLPGTIVFELFGHEIQLLPRVLTIDKKEQPWRSNETIALPEGKSSRQSSLQEPGVWSSAFTRFAHLGPPKGGTPNLQPSADAIQ